MKRLVLVLLVAGLLLLSEALTLISAHADNLPSRNGDTSGAAHSTRTPSLKAEGVEFYYKMDAHARYLDLKTRWQSKHRGELPVADAVTLAKEAYAASDIDTNFDRWLYHGGPSPQIFASRLHLYNTSKKALLDVPLKVSVRVKVGELRVQPDIQMTNFEHLASTARWRTYEEKTIRIPAIAPGEDMRIDLGRFELLAFMRDHPYEWPTDLEVKVSSPAMPTANATLALTPDHFVVPVLY